MELFSWAQLKILIILGGCNFLASVICSLQAPFYPAEAERQGASTTIAGLVIGIYELAGFIACPLVSSMLLPRLGSYISYHLGLLTLGTTTLLFGFLNRLTNKTTFVSLSLLIRILEACGSAMTFVSTYGFLTDAFPDSSGAAFGVIETVYAVGMAAGPPLGEAIYQLGGGSELWSFTLPFLTIGLVVYIALTLSSCSLWSIRKLTKDNDNNNSANRREEADDSLALRPTEEIQDGRKEGVIALLKVPSIFVFYLTVVLGSICLGLITCTLEPHLRQFHLTPNQTGGMFLCFGGFYASFAVIWGMICDRIQRPILVNLTGCLLSLFAFTFMGPCYFIPLEPSIALTGVSLAVFGLALGAINVSSLFLMINEAKRQGCPESSGLSGAISSLWLSGVYLGSFIGPIVAGASFEMWGFRVETLIPMVLSGVTFILLLFVLGLNPSSHSAKIHQTETTPLL